MPTKSSHFLTHKRAVQQFQSERLSRTYVDLQEDPRYSALGRFFFDRLYAPKDFSIRDAGIKKLQHILEGRIYQPMTAAMHKVVELHELSDALDDRMAQAMIDAGFGPKPTEKEYQIVYCRLNNPDQREYQIDLSIEAMQIFHGLSQKWIVAASLKTVSLAARFIGAADLMDFINDGFQAFRKIESIDYFSRTIQKREMAWHQHLMGQAMKESR